MIFATPGRFLDRADAAHQLAAALLRYRGSRPLVLAIPRGGVPIGRVVADALGGELDVVLVRKLGAPGHPELAIGAVDETGRVELAAHAAATGADAAHVHAETARERERIQRRRTSYSPGRPPADASGRTVIVVDDGLATGSTMRAALAAVRAQGPARLVCAVPVAAPDSLAALHGLADDIVCLRAPEGFRAVGQFYRQFEPVEEEQVIALLAPAEGIRRELTLALAGVALDGDLVVPPRAIGLVVFAHGSGSSRLSRRNRAVASVLHAHGIGTLLFDLLTGEEDRGHARRFDIPLLRDRLAGAVDWVGGQSALAGLPLGLFGASTGAAAALAVAAGNPREIAAVVSRGGRPDLAGPAVLARVQAPTLLLVGGADPEVLALNRSALAHLHGASRLEIVPGAGHLFEKPGTLDRVAAEAADWFAHWFGGGEARVGSGAA